MAKPVYYLGSRSILGSSLCHANQDTLPFVASIGFISS
jgi:hypothetical protein